MTLKTTGERVRKTTVYMGLEEAKRLRVYCAQEDRDMSSVITEAVRAYLDEHEE